MKKKRNDQCRGFINDNADGSPVRVIFDEIFSRFTLKKNLPLKRRCNVQNAEPQKSKKIFFRMCFPFFR